MESKKQAKNCFYTVKATRPAVLMVTPFHKQIRGNAITAARIRTGMENLGWQVNIYSLENRRQAICNLKREAVQGGYGMIHGFHAAHISKIFSEIPELRQRPLLLTMTGTDLHSLRMEKNTEMISAALDLASAVTVFNSSEVSFLSRICPAWAEKITVIPQGVVLQNGRTLTREELGMSEKEFIFILPSGLRAIKDIDMAVDGINIINESGYRAKLLIVGPAIELNYTDRLIRRFNLNPEIKYLGAIDHIDMKPLLLLTDVVINCSQSEGQPQALLEAMSLGKPCILTPVPGNINLVENYQEGIYVQNAKEMALAMEFYLKEPAQIKTMGQAAQELVAKQFSAHTEIAAYNTLYQQIISY